MENLFCILFLFYMQCIESYVLQTDALSWSNHETLCQFRFDSNLASIHSSLQNEAVNNMCPNLGASSFCWIGLHDIVIDGDFNWVDGSTLDYGAWGNNQTIGQNWCVSTRNDTLWRDSPCDNTYKAICNDPYVSYIINDKPNYPQIPFNNYILGKIEILDEIYIAFNININSFAATAVSNYSNILSLGTTDDSTYISLFITDSKFQIKWKTVANNTNSFHDTQTLQLHTNYYIKLHFTQNRLIYNVNNHSAYNESIYSHAVSVHTDVYLSDSSGYPANAIITDLSITTSNSYDPNEWNYLCDYDNRFNDIQGTWSLINPCQVYQSDMYVHGAVTWLGGLDNSLNWTNYRIQFVVRIHTCSSFNCPEDMAGILLRAQSISEVNDQGFQYSIELDANLNQLKMSRMANGWNAIDSRSVTVHNDYDHTVRIDAVGHTFDIYLDHKWLFQVHDTNYKWGSIALRTYRAAATFKSLRIMFISNNSLITQYPTASPTLSPTVAPTVAPSTYPSMLPSFAPTISPSLFPTQYPSTYPSMHPVNFPTKAPSTHPSMHPINSSIQLPTISATIITQTDAMDDHELDDMTQVQSTSLLMYLIIIVLCLIGVSGVILCGFVLNTHMKKRNYLNSGHKKHEKIEMYLQPNDETKRNSTQIITKVTKDHNTIREIPAEIYDIDTEGKHEDISGVGLFDDEFVIEDDSNQQKQTLNNTFGNSNLIVGISHNNNNNEFVVCGDDDVLTPTIQSVLIASTAGNVNTQSNHKNDEFIVNGDDETKGNY